MSVWYTQCPKCKDIFRWYSNPRKIIRRCVRCSVAMVQYNRPKPAEPKQKKNLFDF